MYFTFGFIYYECAAVSGIQDRNLNSIAYNKAVITEYVLVNMLSLIINN